MTRQEAFDEINSIQDSYIDELISIMHHPDYTMMKTIDFTSPTGTGKTKMMSKLINRFPEYYFIITTLSKGQLHIQIRESLRTDCKHNNFRVYGSADYRINSVLEAEDIIGDISHNTKCIWLRDEGHIRTNRFDEILLDVCYKVINFSATNMHSDIKCNFTQTMMLRTVNQTVGTPEDAILKLLEVKNAHKKVKNYNPCAIFRCVGGDQTLQDRIALLCERFDLKYIDITEDAYVMAELCEDDNEYDVIINKFKIVEGIDIRRAHVLYMDNQPSNNITTIQAIGRCRRNALLYRTDIDILAPENKTLLKQTRECYVFYNVDKMKISTDLSGELCYAFCNYISCENLKANTTVDVIDGQLANGLYIIELAGYTGKYTIAVDKKTGFNIVEPKTAFYADSSEEYKDGYLYAGFRTHCNKIHVDNIQFLPLNYTRRQYDPETESYIKYDTEPYYVLSPIQQQYTVNYDVPLEIIEYYREQIKILTPEFILSKIKSRCLDTIINDYTDYDIQNIKLIVSEFIQTHKNTKGYKTFSKLLSNIKKRLVSIDSLIYELGEVCSDNEIYILSFFCIERKNLGISNEDIDFLIHKYIEIKSKYFHVKYAMERRLILYFSDISLEDNERNFNYIENYTTTFLLENAEKRGFKNFCKFVSDLSSNSTTIQFNEKIRNIFNSDQLLVIQFFCIKEKLLGKSDNEILLLLNNLVNWIHDFNLARNDIESERITYIIWKEKIESLQSRLYPHYLKVNIDCLPYSLTINCDIIKKHIQEIIDEITELPPDVWLICSEKAVDSIVQTIELTEQELINNTIHEVNYDLSSLFEEVTEEERFLVRNKYVSSDYMVTKRKVNELKRMKHYTKVTNDEESAIIGVDLMQQIRGSNDEAVWIESRAITSKINSFNKLNIYITHRYSRELEEAKHQYFYGANNFDLDKKCNSVIGFCVEYYSKYLVYGESFLGEFIERAKKEAGQSFDETCLIVRACMLKYKEMMIRAFGNSVARVIPGITVETLIKKKYNYFVNLVVDLGTKTADFVTKTLYPNTTPVDEYDPNLSIRHIAGLADYITYDTILDIKVKNHIDEKSIRQVLAYHYLSTKRSDLKIRRVIVYDAVSGRSIVINISNQALQNAFQVKSQLKSIAISPTLKNLPSELKEDSIDENNVMVCKYVAGESIKHQKYGIGSIIKVERISDEMTLLTVRYDNNGIVLHSLPDHASDITKL